MLDVDLEEIQEIDSKKIIEHKLMEASKNHDGEFIVDDTSLYLEVFDYKFPGPLIKWFLQSIGNEEIYKLAKSQNKFGARVQNLIGYRNIHGEIKYFEGIVEGRIVSPIGDNGFGWDMIFVPQNQSNTFAQMSDDEKSTISHRSICLRKLKEFLEI